MFNTTDFIYAGKSLSDYGLRVATIDSSVVEETAYDTPTLNLTKPAAGKRFYYLDSVYEQAPTFEFSVLGETELAEERRRAILRWLDNRRGFQELRIDVGDGQTYIYKCIFNVTSAIYHVGRCIGFKLKATFDSHYCYISIRYNVTNEKNKSSENNNEYSLCVINNSDIIDEYVYPTVYFKPIGYIDDDQHTISIINLSDDLVREFAFKETPLNAEVKVDNELKIISSNGSGDYLSKFDGMKWLRLKQGANNLKVKINGECKIVFPQYIKIKL